MNKSIKYQNAIATHLLPHDMDVITRKNVRKYLVGDHERLLGTILSFKKFSRVNNPFSEQYAVLLYYSHETGRIERFIYNKVKDKDHKIVFVNDKVNISRDNPNNTYLDQSQKRYGVGESVSSKVQARAAAVNGGSLFEVCVRDRVGA